VLFRLKALHSERLPDRYPFLLCPNHVSYFDAFLLAGILPNRVLKRIIILGYEDYFAGPITGYLGRALRVVPVNPDRGLPLSLRLAAEALRRGMVLLVFPEGERSIDGTLKIFRKGPSILAVNMAAPAVPVGISGTYEAWPRGRGKPKLHPVTIDFGPPVEADGKSVDEFTRELFEGVQRVLPSEQSRLEKTLPSRLTKS
jgi:long-chain acyl-CoA synthetase